LIINHLIVDLPPQGIAVNKFLIFKVEKQPLPNNYPAYVLFQTGSYFWEINN
jgi:hypothetical protein